MSNRGRTVVVSRAGVWSPLGYSVGEFEANLFAGKCAIKPITRVREMQLREGQYDDFPIKLAGEVREPNDGDLKTPSVMQLSGAGRFTRYALAAAEQALGPKLFIQRDDPERVGIFVGNGGGGREEAEKAQRQIEGEGIFEATKHAIRKKGVNRRAVCQVMNNSPAGKIAEVFSWDVKGHTYEGMPEPFKIRGDNHAISAACASFTVAAGAAYRAIKYGDLDVAVVVGTEALLTPTVLGTFGWLDALNKTDSPTNPFSQERKEKGFDMGEGAAVFVFETPEHAANRGAYKEIMAEIAGYGAAGDAHKDTSPHPQGRGMFGAMRKALEDAGLRPQDVHYINAHGTGTYHNDRTETLAIKKLYPGVGGKIPPISATKSQTGHLIGASGGVELLACILALKRGAVPPTLNYATPDHECDLDCVPHEARALQRLEVILNNSFAFGGSNASLVVQKYP
jgi:3-oxoacyl-[acyl-carrier-protein] synthase II